MKNQSGSAIFIILVGIALFAALSYVVAQSLRVSGDAPSKTSKEKLDLQFIDIGQFLDLLKVRFVKLTVADKIPVLSLSFKNDVYKNVDASAMCESNDNAACTTAACEMFSPYAPDGIRPAVFTEISAPTEPISGADARNGTISVMQLGIDGIGTSAHELVVQIFGISPEFCNFYNKKYGMDTAFDDTTTLTDINETPASSVSAAWGSCSGSAGWTSGTLFGDEAKLFIGKQTFCAPIKTDAAVARLGITYVLQAR